MGQAGRRVDSVTGHWGVRKQKRDHRLQLLTHFQSVGSYRPCKRQLQPWCINNVTAVSVDLQCYRVLRTAVRPTVVDIVVHMDSYGAILLEPHGRCHGPNNYLLINNWMGAQFTGLHGCLAFDRGCLQATYCWATVQGTIVCGDVTCVRRGDHGGRCQTSTGIDVCSAA